MKIGIRVLLSIAIFLNSIGGYSYADGIDIEINGRDFGGELGAFLGEDSIYVDAEKMAEKLSYDFDWNLNDQSINLLKDGSNLKLYLNDKKGNFNGKPIETRHHVLVRNNRAYTSLDIYSVYLEKLIYIDYDYSNISIFDQEEVREDFFNETKNRSLNKKLRDFMSLYEEEQNFQGAVLVAKNDEILLNEAFGLSNRELNLKNYPQTKFGIGSLTKQFIGVGIIQMKTRGKLEFDHTIDRYLEGFKYGSEISIHQLLTHTSGLKDITKTEDFYNLEDSSVDLILDLVKDEDLKASPGQVMDYNHINYIILTKILEVVSGETLEDYLYKNIFEPLSMKNTGFAYGSRPGFLLATPYDGYIDLYEIDDSIMLSKLHGAGSMYSTVEDMYRWTEALEGEEILSKEEKEILFRGYEDMGNMTKYSYGLMVGKLGKYNFYQHDGSTLGFSSLVSKIDEKDLTVVILGNKRKMDLYKINGGLQRISQGGKVDLDSISKFPTEIKIDKKAYENYKGTYSLTSPIDGFVFSMKIFQEGEDLFLQVDNQDPIGIYPMGDDSFFTREIEASLKFHLGDGRAEAVTLTQMDVEFYGKRKNNN